MQLINNGFIKFDYQFPIYNFFFPSQSFKVYQPSAKKLSKILNTANLQARSRALYFHIPFCEAICSFCPFTRGLYKNSQDIDRYTRALISEIEYKANLIDLKAVPIRAIFFGGGTPSLLSPRNIHDIGEALHRHFDMCTVEEFSFEFNVSSVTPEKVSALAEIGVSHARFELQTIDPEWRRLFNLDPDIGQIELAAKLLLSKFDNVLCDIMYGMNGSSELQTLTDIDKAVELGLSNIDIYPINNAATSVKLHRQIKARFTETMSAMRKLNMKFMIDAHLRQKGYVPYNGHGYVYMPGVTEPLITDGYSFIYHEHVYGYTDHDLLGFGVGAISSVAGNVITNTSLREKYTQRMAEGECLCQVSQHEPLLDAVKPLVLRLPYHGKVEKGLMAVERMPKGLMERLNSLIEADLVVESENDYRLTRLGWIWYSNIMFYLIPESEQNILRQLVYERLDTPGRDITEDELIYAAS
ncbi:coproporphyrinogen-III oxidase family protein [Pseudomonas gingeri]|uniref:coproporphyrinogen-III oxidase family protein n=1 Tax=Pseudomonas gingeri TaxID=117681 RepID=UPI00159FB02B|nr:radical SAM protein [Pseudomonas gingeri]NWA03064.1 radical SAM protein [Pseudomonas gingeri]NWA17211.1 radical SAM protein [Pseudomonas gingeri]NWA57925.1 radical SAM protein [Pseudomonas gingeri]NWA98695.1 radical SAM protein [Pseudomonas gingeri]NWB02485.1 radical SAM protein [Pseudomonas gingeri]